MKIQTDRLFEKVEELERDNILLVKKIVNIIIIYYIL